MRNRLLLPLLLLGLWSCSDDDSFISVNLPDRAFSFTPMAGGAVMHYILPDDPDIVGVGVRYEDARGNDMLRVGSSTCDSLELVGFDEAVANVPAQVTLQFADGRESQPFDVTFDTKDSGPVTFMKSAQIVSNWEGFALKYYLPEKSSGMAHVYYVGINPHTQLPDTIRIESFVLDETEEEQFLPFKMAQDVQEPTVIVRVEDFRGYMLDEKVWEKVPGLHMKKLDKEHFEFFCDNSIEDDKIDMLGAKYLFDGDTKGLIQWEDGKKRKCYSFLAGPDGGGEAAHPMYFDLQEDKNIGELRIYTMLDHANSPLWGGPGAWWEGIPADYTTPAGPVHDYNENEMPREVTLYALKDDGGKPLTYADMHSLEGWEQIGHFMQSNSLEHEERWCYGCRSNSYDAMYLYTQAEVEAAEERYLTISIPAEGKKYRYLKMVVDNLFELSEGSGGNYENRYNYVQFHELEIYTD